MQLFITESKILKFSKSNILDIKLEHELKIKSSSHKRSIKQNSNKLTKNGSHEEYYWKNKNKLKKIIDLELFIDAIIYFIYVILWMYSMSKDSGTVVQNALSKM